MLRNHLTIAFRNLLRNKVHSIINIIGLAVSLTAFLLMALYIEFELSYDGFHANADRIYRVADDKQTPGVTLESASTAAPVAPALLADFPQVQQAVRLIDNEALIRYGDKLFEERKILFADRELFKLFSFKLLQGNPATALQEPMSIVLTEKMAGKYFGAANPMDKTLTVDNQTMKVTGVVRDVPANSHIGFDFLVSMATAQMKGSGYDWLFTNWYSNNFYTYILLPENFDAARFSAELSDFDTRHHEPGSTTKHGYALEKLTDIYLHSDRSNQIGPTGNLTNLYVFSLVAVFILVIACVNFINLATARASERAKEVGVKKVIGAARSQVMAQFFLESFLMTTLSLCLALLLVCSLLPAFGALSGQDISRDVFSLPHLGMLAALLVFIGIASGMYPAIVLSGFAPASALKGKIAGSASSIFIRKGLVIFQFTISAVLIICTCVVFSQLQFMQRHQLGFRHTQTLVINFEGDPVVRRQYETIRRQLSQIPGVGQVTASSNVPGDGRAGGWSMDFAKRNQDTLRTELAIYLTDYDYLAQYEIPIVAGRGFSETFAEDGTESMIINETALKKLGFASAQEAIGVKVGMYPVDGRIIGVFRDFHFQSLQKPIDPLAMRVIPEKFRLFSLQVSTGDIARTVASIERVWKTLAPQRPLEYSFLDETFNRQYNSETKFGQVFTVFASLAIVIACLGLFGLALFSVRQRQKEIGIRKVLGASVAGIVALLSKDFVYLVAVSIFIAAPMAWYCMRQWLEGFAYRTTISVWIFALAGVICVLIALVTVSFQAVKAALSNPVKSLRSE